MSNPNSSNETKTEFSVRIVVCDHYLTRPIPGVDVIYSDFRGSDVKQVPVLRIFGSAPDGHKVCLHIHGVFPYFYVPCPIQNPESQFLYQIAASLDKALNIALKQANSMNQHVYKISLVKGLPFYGFHDKDHLYLKVFLYNPGLIKHAVELCSNGALLGQTFQPHESHLSFTLQFFIDFNLFGMSNIDLQGVKFRKTGLSQNSNEPVKSFDEFTVKPESICYYEADCIASHIINRQRIGKRDGIENPGLEEVWNQESERRKQLNMSLALKSLTQGRIKAEETESHYKFEQMFLTKMSNLIDKSVNVEVELKKDLDKVYYPAESVEGSQFFNAFDVSMHLPNHGISICETSKRILDNTLTEDIDGTIVDENVALNSSLSLHYSQVMLNSEDLELVDMLQDMDEKHIEEDSVMGTPAEVENEADVESDDAEYSQIFDEETILLNPDKSKDDADKNSLSWNDSFWDGANIPQLDGTSDDDHVKKVRKRKMRSFKLGLSRPKVKKKDISKSNNEESEAKSDSDTDAINASRETINSISELYLKKSVKTQDKNNVSNSKNIVNKDSVNKFQIIGETIVNSVKEETVKHNGVKLGMAESYDLEKQYEPIAGASHANNIMAERCLKQNDSINISFESFPDDSKLGIMSFYDTSKIFDISLDDDKTQSLRNNLNMQNDQQKVKQEPKTSNKECNEVLDKKLQVEFKETLETMQNNIYNNFDTSIILTPKIRPPTKSYVVSNLEKYKIPKIKNPSPYFSHCKDVGDKIEIGQMVLKLCSKVARDQKPYEKVLDNTSIEEWRQLLFLQRNEITEDSSKPEALKILLAGNAQYVLEPVKKPPTRKGLIKWLQEKKNNREINTIAYTEITENIDEVDNSQVIGLNENEINNSISLESNDDKNKTLVNSTIQVTMQPDGSFLCFGSSENKKECSMLSPTVEVDFLTLMLLEVLTSVRGDLNPDPTIDPIQAVFIKVVNDCPPNHFLMKSITEIIVVDPLTPPKLLDRCVFNENVTYVDNENELLEKVIKLVRKHDPDIMCGHEIEMNSWGYVIERSQVLGLEMVKEISRITDKNRQKRWKSEDNYFEGRIIGRITFNVWRLLRHELALSSYSFENTMYEILKERVPTYSYAQLAEWWNDESRILRWIPVEYYLTKLIGTVRMLEKLDIIKRTSELARLFGMQWWEVLSRGSQYRVESLMLRAARPLNLVALSPTIKQRSTMRAPECLPLIFEPESRFYSDPVIVLDFQSLYPSMMIAYNYCFSTCIGHVQNINGEYAYEFGAWRLRIPKSKLDTLIKNGLIHWSPVGVGFVKSSVRRGVLPALLRRILAARQAVKKSMKMQTDENVKKAMHSRQLGLKLIANVTYGYTAANFSGRMPCVEVADSVVSKGRETLERAIQLVKNNKQWNAKVVYGDTDSMFVHVPGGTRAEAFEIGQQIADAVTADNPSPVALKLEKVYQPCILQTKKRYVGYMYESPDQATPVYEAKGIETVRRDGCPAGVKLLKHSLCELFDSGDMSRVKRIVMTILSRLADGTLPAHELFFTREYHGPTGYKPGAIVPPNEIAKRILSRDRRAVPRTGERVRWLVLAGAAGPLARLARGPHELATGPMPRPHVTYYATRVLLPPLHRCLSLLGVNVFKWWNELGHTREVHHNGQGVSGGGIARYMWRERCAVCGARGARAVCASCTTRAHRTTTTLATMLHVAQVHVAQCDMICGSCCGHAQSLQCENTECPVFWRKHSARHKLTQVRDVIVHLPPQFTKESLDF